ncbi:uncharacterized protein LOC128883191 isoform X2 [Hylaeus volcanicus]|uniref:uncharacterized protein LOC128883191 isoform X2 n=1 Tax=Hylaeus volcanicus TaxID=313075 RepID=UPI0023B845E8|nr:uncharacterized protein LOC128883191 isoform X2 [Hylaeus volcanicus]
MKMFRVAKNGLQRHSILDLSRCHNENPEVTEIPLTSSFEPQYPRRIVASKRRPGMARNESQTLFNLENAANNKVSQQSLVQNYATPENKDAMGKILEDNLLCVRQNDTKQEFNEVSEKGDVFSYAATKVVKQALESYKELKTRSCTVYEPVVTFKYLSAFPALFHDAVNYFKTQSKELQTTVTSFCHDKEESQQSTDTFMHRIPLFSSIITPTMLSHSFNDTLKKTTHEISCESLVESLESLRLAYENKLLELDKIDSLIVTLIYGVESEHTALYEYQKTWLEQIKGKQTQVKDSSLTQIISEETVLPQWSAKELERLESLEKAKKLVLTFCSKEYPFRYGKSWYFLSIMFTVYKNVKLTISQLKNSC